MATTQENPELPKARQETFDVLLLAKGKSEFDAKPDDFVRVTVRAASTLAASSHSAVVEAAKEHYPFAVMPHSVLHPAEIMARQRAQAGNVVDKSKV